MSDIADIKADVDTHLCKLCAVGSSFFLLTDARPRQDFLASPAKMVRLLKEKLQAGNSTHADSSILYVLGATDAYTVAIVKVSIIWTDNTDFYVSFYLFSCFLLELGRCQGILPFF
jgi:hypothetical protein